MRTIRVAEGCTRCPILVANRRRVVHGYGADNARVFFVGEAPGYRGADLTGVPFTLDRSGVRLQRMLIELGLSAEVEPGLEQPRLRCFLTNVVRCNPPSNRTPTRAEIANCQPYLWQELDLIKPRIIVPVGNVAARAVFLHLLNRAPPPHQPGPRLGVLQGWQVGGADASPSAYLQCRPAAVWRGAGSAVAQYRSPLSLRWSSRCGVLMPAHRLIYPCTCGRLGRVATPLLCT